MYERKWGLFGIYYSQLTIFERICSTTVSCPNAGILDTPADSQNWPFVYDPSLYDLVTMSGRALRRVGCGNRSNPNWDEGVASAQGCL
ncbi:hypothetical protein Bind_1919 [Beijerinckia indica subsp. indica ATCC 9039]|uniref:Uncharacterized protein n=1 Tax=Beijerinckia indica subsp. indica (strain ATCC 9039 / DSM 1715 / NCIMB 8712) TaxID=395963 RepID=B2IEE5_BEII9|nr:hypothetical protein Bind_1919 [Beijerinckia indica subsp. indica ATCC 9039]